MLCFPNAKINIGLNITEKRKDNFHNIETIFYPVYLYDVLELIELSGGERPFVYKNTGIPIQIPDDENIVIRALNLLKIDYYLPPLQIHLHKNIPFGAGLGGGSSNAAFMIKALNKVFGLNIPDEKQEEYAGRLGSDCAFFIRNCPAFAYNRGEKLEPIELDLSNYYILLVKPEIAINTAEAYANTNPRKPIHCLKKLIQLPVNEWKGKVVNDFEKNIFTQYPVLEQIKIELYQLGALYAAMSGSGSTIYGIFKEEPVPSDFLKKHFTWKGKLLVGQP